LVSGVIPHKAATPADSGGELDKFNGHVVVAREVVLEVSLPFEGIAMDWSLPHSRQGPRNRPHNEVLAKPPTAWRTNQKSLLFEKQESGIPARPNHIIPHGREDCFRQASFASVQ